MLNKTNILVIFLLFTLGCINLPESAVSNATGQGITKADIDATVMAMSEASNSNETVKKAPPTDTQVNITSANTEQAVSVNLEATKEAFSKQLQDTSVPDASNNDSMDINTVIQDMSPDNNLVNSTPTVVMLPTPTPQDTKGPLPTPTPSMNNPDIIVRYFGPDGPHERCADVDFTNTNGFPVSIGYKLNFFQGSILNTWHTNKERGNFNYITAGGTALRRICGLEQGITVEAIITGVSPNPVFMINPGGSYVHVDPKINRAGDLEINSIPKLYETASNGSWGGSYVFTNHNVSEYAPVIACMDVVWKDSGKLYQVECSRLNISPSSKSDLRITFDKNYSGEELFIVRPRGIWTVLLSSVFTSALPATPIPTPTQIPNSILGQEYVDDKSGMIIKIDRLSQNTWFPDRGISITFVLSNRTQQRIQEGNFYLMKDNNESVALRALLPGALPGDVNTYHYLWQIPWDQKGIRVVYGDRWGILNEKLSWNIPSQCVPAPSLGWLHDC